MSDSDDNKAEENHDSEEKKPKSKKKLIIIIIFLLLIIGGGAGAYFMGMLDSFIGGAEHSEEANEDGEHDKSGHHENNDSSHSDDSHGEDAANATQAEAMYHSLPEFVANLNPGSATPSFIKIKVTIEAANEKIITKIQEKQPKIRDIVNTYLRELRPSDLKGSAGIYRLREELTFRVNKILYPDKINSILVQDILIQ